jgi:hypothetical protein
VSLALMLVLLLVLALVLALPGWACWTAAACVEVMSR